jgi:hypothetical protein
MLVATGGFTLQPFASNVVVHNLGVSLDRLPMIYRSGGILGLFAGLSDVPALPDRGAYMAVSSSMQQLRAHRVSW